MADLGQRMREHRELRDAAKHLLQADLSTVKRDVNEKPFVAQITENTSQFARENKTVLGAGLAIAVLALFAWLLRDHLADMLTGDDAEDAWDDEEDWQEPDPRAPRSHSNDDFDEE